MSIVLPEDEEFKMRDHIDGSEKHSLIENDRNRHCTLTKRLSAILLLGCTLGLIIMTIMLIWVIAKTSHSSINQNALYHHSVALAVMILCLMLCLITWTVAWGRYFNRARIMAATISDEAAAILDIRLKYVQAELTSTRLRYDMLLRHIQKKDNMFEAAKIYDTFEDENLIYETLDQMNIAVPEDSDHVFVDELERKDIIYEANVRTASPINQHFKRQLFSPHSGGDNDIMRLSCDGLSISTSSFSQVELKEEQKIIVGCDRNCA